MKTSHDPLTKVLLRCLIIICTIVGPIYLTHSQTKGIDSEYKIAPDQTNAGGRAQQAHIKELNFKSVRVGNTSTKILKLRNETGSAMTITRINFDNHTFSSLENQISVAPYSEVLLHVTFAPDKQGIQRGFLSLTANGKTHSPVKIKLVGEGLNSPPITITPQSIAATVHKDSGMQEMLTITNNGSFTRTYNIAVIDGEYTKPSPGDLNGRFGLRETLQVSNSKGKQPVMPPLNKGLTISEVTIPNLPVNLPDTPFYATGFEEFDPGTIDQQNAWTSTPGWEILTTNPDRGTTHLRGVSGAAGEESFARSPMLYDYGWNMETPSTGYFTFTARINVDQAVGTAWDIGLRDNYELGITNIHINPDKTFSVSGLSGLGYRGESVQLAVATQGYFDIAVEQTFVMGGPAFNVFSLYINNVRVYKGYTMGSPINQVTFSCQSNQPGAILDIDDVVIRRGDFVPPHIIPASLSGILRPKETKQIPIDIDVKGMKFGTFSSQIVTTIDSVEQFAIPVSVKVTGRPRMRVQPESYYFIGWEFFWMDFVLRNEGGEDINYTIDEIPGAMNPQMGVIPPEFAARHFIGWGPKLIVDSLTIRTDIPDQPVFYVPITSIIYEPMTTFDISTSQLHFEVREGETATDTIYVANLAEGFEEIEWDGSVTWIPAGDLSYYFLVPPGKGLSVTPYKGILPGPTRIPVTVSLNATGLSPGFDSTTIILYNTNNVKPVYPLKITYMVHPANQSTSSTGLRTEQNELTIYPNPARSSRVTIGLPRKARDGEAVYCTVVSLTGRVVHTQHLKADDSGQTFALNLPANLSPGVYAINVVVDGVRYARRLMVY